MTSRSIGTGGAAVVNAAASQIGWFACVLGGAAGWGTAGALVALALVTAHVVFAEHPGREWPLVLAAASLGLVVDTLHAGVGVLRFHGHEAGALAPLWIVALWAQFGTVLHYCLRWLSKRYRLAAVVGAVGGPGAFLAGERLGAVAFGEVRWVALSVVAFSWAIALPLLMALADRLGGAGRYTWCGRDRERSESLGLEVAGGG